MTRNDLDNKIIKKMYLEGKVSAGKLAKLFDISQSTILRRLRKKGVDIRTTSESMKGNISPNKGKKMSKEFCKKISRTMIKKGLAKGNKNPHWKGGRYINKVGYVLIHNPNHPIRCSAGAYVLEHDLIMEKKLGRYLTREEVVHHIDFDKANNNINNLYLFPNISEHQKHHHFLKHLRLLKD